MTTRLPNGDEAILDIRKIEDYCLSPSHPRGRHKARVFREVLDLQQPEQQLARGQVGTIVELLDRKTLLVEFRDDQGRAYAVAPCPRADLLVLHYVPQPA